MALWVKKEDVCKVCLLLLASFRQIFERKVDQSFDNYSRLFLYKFEESYCVVFIGGKTKCVKMNETLNQWKAL